MDDAVWEKHMLYAEYWNYVELLETLAIISAVFGEGEEEVTAAEEKHSHTNPRLINYRVLVVSSFSRPKLFFVPDNNILT